MALPVARWAASDFVLLLWTTHPLLEKALEIIRAWGVTYRTFGWAKLNKAHAGLLFDDISFFTSLGFWTGATRDGSAADAGKAQAQSGS